MTVNILGPAMNEEGNRQFEIKLRMQMRVIDIDLTSSCVVAKIKNTQF